MRIGDLGNAWYVFGKMEERDVFSWNVHVLRFGFESDVDVVNALITMYVKGGDAQSARLMFNRMPRRDRISWNAMISGYFENGECLRMG